jgi:hypothetical protein
MTAPTADLENSIQMALEAAAAANDTAEDVSKLSSDVQAAAGRLDKWGKQMKPVMIGLIAGAGLSIALGGLVYFRTLSEMRTTSAMHVEALSLFSKSVTELQAEVTKLAAMEERMIALETVQAEGFARLDGAMAQNVEALTAAMAPSETEGDKTEGPLPQMLRGLVETVEGNHKKTQETFKAGLSDLQLAMTRMIADGIKTAPAAASASAQQAAAPRPTATKPKKPPVKKAPATSTNPFKYP